MRSKSSPPRSIGRYTGRASAASLALLVTVSFAAQGQDSRGLGRLKRGDPAPAFHLRAVDRAPVTSDGKRDAITILLFGETDHARTREATRLVDDARRDPGLRDAAVEWIVLLTKGSDAERWPRPGDATGPIVVHDTGREAFGEFGVTVVPSIVIIDRAGRIVHALPGLAPSAGDIVTDALLFAAGRIDLEAFARTLDPPALPVVNPELQRADRLTRLAQRMAEHGMIDEALAKFEEASRLDPSSIAAQVGLGVLRLERGQLDAAATRFRTVLAIEPSLTVAALGLATVQLQRESGDIDQVESLVRTVLERDPGSARAHYVLGRVHERRGQVESAAASFRRASELLLKKTGWTRSNGGDDHARRPGSG